MYIINPMNKKGVLLKQLRKIFNTDDLAVLWGITNRNTLRTTIKRYLEDGTLVSVRKGLYSVTPLNELDKYLLGTSYVRGFCYVSLQTVLENSGLINQKINKITLIGNKSSEFSIASHNYICKKLDKKYLFNDNGIILGKDYPIASIERAIADILYYNPKFHFDSNIEPYMEKVKLIQNQVYQ